MKFETKLTDNERVVSTWKLSKFVHQGNRGSEEITLTNRRFIYEKKGDKFIEKEEFPIDSVQSITSATTYKRSPLVVGGLITFLLGLVICALYFLKDTLKINDYIYYVLGGGGAIFLIGFILFLIGLANVSELVVSFKVTHNGGAVSQVCIPNSIEPNNAKYTKQCLELINSLYASILEIQDNNKKELEEKVNAQPKPTYNSPYSTQRPTPTAQLNPAIDKNGKPITKK